MKASFYSVKSGKWETKSLVEMTRAELRDALKVSLDTDAERTEHARANADERAALRREVEALRAEKVRLECRLDATLYAMVLMQNVLKLRERELRAKDGGDSLALAV